MLDSSIRTSVKCPSSRLWIFAVAAVSVAEIWGSVATIADEDFAASGRFSQGVVAADHPAASEAGAEILRKGGNVVDAAVATSFALSVVRPASCGIGGGGFMVIYDARTESAVALDYRERAPAAASREMFEGDADRPDSEPGSVRGGRACGIPGTVAGLCYAAEHYGTMPLPELLAPAIRLAENGVAIDQHDQSVQSSALARLERFAGYEQRFRLLKRNYLNDGKPWQSGERFHSPLLRVLMKIANEGADGFYTGDVASGIVDAVQNAGGILTLDDLQTNTVVVREPLADDYRGRTIFSMPPASSGGVALIQTLQAVEVWEAKSGRSVQSLQHNSADYIHVVTEAMKHAFADRAEFLGDTDYVSVPISKLIDQNYAAQIADRIDDRKTLPRDAYGRFFAEDDGGTSHFSVMDADGNAVACTETINLTYGSFVVVPKYGILLNNEIDDFAARPGIPNAFGLIQSEANAIEPGKKPLSSMTPTIVVQNGKASYSTGASGGPRIITAAIQSVMNHILFEMTPDESVSAPRFHHQWSPNVLRLEPELFRKVGSSLQARGHQIQQTSSLAACQAAARTAKGLFGGSDPRKHGRPAGY